MKDKRATQDLSELAPPEVVAEFEAWLDEYERRYRAALAEYANEYAEKKNGQQPKGGSS